MNVLYNYLEANNRIPWEDLRYLFGEIMYGGHITGMLFSLKMSCSWFKGWNQLNHQPVLKFPHFFPASLQEKTAGISKLVDDEASSIL